ncbi:site-specific integrase [Nocardioides humilatus]|uniref:Site-specific integrase n=1 Tax=Nocardioides humilatus TaxID=2607660 RepID=A0A5B1L5M8_9ACTN|nr:site-specific integrase [Nocardioides humilatus]KAA1415972.1 site-specific integrase [Nocardioides humilatus]
MGHGRPPTSVGTWGAIRTTRVREGAYRSRTRIRDRDGVTREVTATGTTIAAAERALREKLVDRATPTQQAITADTSVAKLAALWLAYLREEGRIEATTINEYERVLTKVVVPELGGLRLRELTTSRLDLFLVRLRATSTSRQRKTKVVMGAMLGLAVRHDALVVNPVQQTSRIHRDRPETRSLTLQDLNTVREALRAWTSKQRPGPKANGDMADIIDLMLATGARIGEILALRWVDVSLSTVRPNLTINGTIKTEPGKGTYRKATPKSDASVRTVALPDFAVAVLQRRRKSKGHNPVDAVFPTRNGTWQQVNNVERRWRQIRQDTGLDWVTPHTFRKTVATLISERVGAETASQQLGHSSPAITREFYISKPAIAADVAHVLEELADPDPDRGPNTSGLSGE